MNKFDVKEFTDGAVYENISIPDGYKNVRFAGYLCLAVDSDTEDTNYFAVDSSGKATLCFKLLSPGRKPTFAIGKASSYEEDKSSPIIYRHFRLTGMEGISNMGGMTVAFVINYDKKTLDCYPAICSINDNFDKRLGIKLATEGYMCMDGFTIDYYSTLTLQENLVYSFRFNKMVWMSPASKERLEQPLNNFMVKL